MYHNLASVATEYYEFDSRCIRSAKYSPSTRRLVISFVRGANSYSFYRVPRAVVTGLVNATSPGSYYHNHIAGRFEL